MSEVFVDLQNDGFNLTEVAGYAVELVREVVVAKFNLPDVNGEIETDPEKILAKLDAAVVDLRPGALFEYRGKQMVLVDRDLDIMEHSTASGKLTYRYWPEVWRGGTGLRQVVTGKDRSGTNLEVCYPTCHPNGVSQGGEIAVSEPALVLGIDYMRALEESPLSYVKRYLGRVNSAAFLGQGPGQWLCTKLDFEEVVSVPGQNLKKWWHFSAEFELDELGHQPEIVFRLNETGKPPPDVVDGVGRKVVDWFLEADFSQEFPPL
jgi:hypothetical protein